MDSARGFRSIRTFVRVYAWIHASAIEQAAGQLSLPGACVCLPTCCRSKHRCLACQQNPRKLGCRSEKGRLTRPLTRNGFLEFKADKL